MHFQQRLQALRLTSLLCAYRLDRSIFRTPWYSSCIYPYRDYASFGVYRHSFIVRTVQPVLSDIETELGRGSFRTRCKSLADHYQNYFTNITPCPIYGFVLAFARGVGEYGSVIFIAGNQPFKTEIAPLMIISRLEEYDYAGATTIAAVMLVLSSLFYLSLTYFKHGQTVAQGETLRTYIPTAMHLF